MNNKDGLVFEVENSDKKNYLVTFMNADDNIIEYEIEMINNNTSCGAINIETRQFNDEIKIMYDITGKESLVDFLKVNSMKKGQFLTILRNISNVIIECKNYFLDEDKYFMNLDYIYINPIDLSISLIYLPFERAISEKCSLKFIDIVKKIILEYTDFEDAGNDRIVQKILNYLKNDWVSINDFNKFMEEFGKGNVKVFYATGEVKEEKVQGTVKEVIKEVVKEPEKPITITKATIEVSRKKDSLYTSFFNKFKKKNKDKSKDKTKGGSRRADTGLINSTPNNSSKREIMTEMSYETILLDSKVAYLINKKAGTVEKICINKDIFKIGRRLGEVDYVTDNKAVGKIHMEFRIMDSKYYIVDLNSKNGTFINGKRLESNKEYEVENKDIIMLANCKFTFQIE